MKLFWALMAGLVVAAGVLLALRSGEQPAGAATPTSRTSAGPGSEAGMLDSAAEGSAGGAADAPAESADEPAGTGAESEPAPESGAEIPATPEPAPDAALESAPDTAPGEIAAAEEPVAVEPVPASPAPAEAGSGEGVLVLNDRYRVSGAGTASDPYKVDFDMLVALEHEYEPKTQGKEQVPEWIKPLDNKHVEITGFIGFPFIAPSADECMVMLNQWDGCCIGVPPTPYDAVEVKLAEPVDLSRGVPNYGTIRGVFRTDPYLVNGWLIGLYVMDDATLSGAGSKNQSGY